MSVKTPKLTWGTSFAQTWTFPGPVDNPVPRQILRGATVETKSGLLDVWEDRVDAELTITVPLIPKAAAGSATGYSDSNGVQAALVWLQRGGLARYFPDADGVAYKTVQAVGFNPEQDVERSAGGVRYTVRLRLRTTDASTWTEH
jgi:hypothetical protein